MFPHISKKFVSGSSSTSLYIEFTDFEIFETTYYKFLIDTQELFQIEGLCLKADSCRLLHSNTSGAICDELFRWKVE
jgi:hypothetical protein